MPALQLAQVRGDLQAWVLRTVPGATPDDARQLVRDVGLAVVIAGDTGGLRQLGAWTAHTVRAVAVTAAEVDAEPDDGFDDPDPEAGARAVAAIGPFVGFLVDTGRWTGPVADLAGVQEALDEVSPVGQSTARLAGVVADPPGGLAAEVAALPTTALAHQLQALLAWVSPRRTVTASGALRPADLPEATALVGLDLGARRVRSMGDLARLPHVWRCLVDAGLVEVGSTAASPTAAGRALLDDPTTAHQALATAVVTALEDRLAVRPTQPWAPDTCVLALPLLAAAVSQGPVPAQGLEQAEQFGPVRAQLDELAALGVVELGADGSLAVPPGLHRLLALAVLRALDTETGGNAGPGVAATAATADVLAGSSALRLRVELRGAQPPVRRDVVVRADLPVGDLHDVVQAAFGWDDSHLHEFTQLRDGRSPAPVAERTPVARAARGGRDALRYADDFGDSWEHRITLLSAVDAEGPLPRCVGALGRCPDEDSGGVWGWTAKVAAANDPADADHDEVREWLGFQDGEQLDARAVDVAACDRRLGGRRR